MPGLRDKVTFRGVTVDYRLQLALQEVEKMLGYELTIIQGSFSTSCTASAGTHSGGGAVDLAPYQWRRKVRALRTVGFAAWHRPAIAGLWGEHIHAVLIGDPLLAPAAVAQVRDYYAGKDGLADNDPDTDWRPNPIPTFDPTQGGNVDKARVAVKAARAHAKTPRRRRILGTAAHALGLLGWWGRRAK